MFDRIDVFDRHKSPILTETPSLKLGKQSSDLGSLTPQSSMMKHGGATASPSPNSPLFLPLAHRTPQGT